MRDKYDALGLFHDQSDRRLLVPKRNRWMGWTINVDHPYGRIALAAIGVAFAGAVIFKLATR